MKIAIITQPLFRNYGGILQNYALQVVLRRMGHTPITIDYRRRPLYFKWLLTCCKSVWLLLRTGKWRGIVPFPKWYRPKVITSFIQENIVTTERVKEYKRELLELYDIEGIIVGSDQVWRPTYNKNTLRDMFLQFASALPIKKLAYAASFGVDVWEFSEEDTQVCQQLIKQFSAVSVRESSGVSLCSQYLNCPAVEVLDPTFLLKKSDYEVILDKTIKESRPYILCYSLNMNLQMKSFVEKLATERKMQVKYISAEEKMSLSIEGWLAQFYNASFVVTDSFHGTVFSIVFERQFFVFVNAARGNSRLESLLGKLKLSDRLVSETRFPVYIEEINYQDKIQIIENERNQSLFFLSNNLRPE